MSNDTEPASGYAARLSSFTIGGSILGSLALALLLNWGICTNAFGFSSEIEHRILLIGFAGWACIALAWSDRNWFFLLVSFSLVLLLLRELVIWQDPTIFGISIIALVGVILFDLLFITKGNRPLLILAMQVIFILFMVTTSALWGAYFLAPRLSQELQQSIYYAPLVAFRIMLSCLFVGIAVVTGLMETWKKAKPSFVEWTSAPQWWKENPQHLGEWFLLPFYVAFWVIFSVVAVVINMTFYFWRLLVFIVFETGKEAAVFVRDSLRSSLWKTLARVGTTAIVFLGVVVLTLHILPSVRHIVRSSQSRMSDLDPQLLWSYGFIVAAYSLSIAGVGLLAIAWRSKRKAWERAGVTGVSLLLALWLAQWVSLVVNFNFNIHPIFFRTLGLFMVTLGAILFLGLIVGIARRKVPLRT